MYFIEFRNISDEVLAEKAGMGGEVEFAALFARYVFLIKARASFYNTPEIEQEDLVQEGTIGFMKAVKGYTPDGGASFRTYAGLCIDRSMISAVKKTLAKKQIPFAARISIDDAEFESSETPETVVIARDEMRKLFCKLNSVLSDFERTVFLLYTDGVCYSEIADKLGVSVKSVDNALQRVRRKISN